MEGEKNEGNYGKDERHIYGEHEAREDHGERGDYEKGRHYRGS